jgi:hypothetical protein
LLIQRICLEKAILEVNIASLEGGFFQNMELSASSSMSVFIPYLIIEDGNNYVQNSTIVDLEKGDSVTLSILAPPRTENMVVIIGRIWTRLLADSGPRRILDDLDK